MNVAHLLAGSFFACLAGTSAFAAPVVKDHVEAELVAEHQTFRPGDFDNWIALRLRPEPGWHVYWRNPGDSGIATSLQWQLPPGVAAGDMQWPFPHRHSLGPLTNYGYGEETLHLVPLRIESAPADGSPLRLSAVAKWLVCADICIPGEAQLDLSLPVDSASPKLDKIWETRFQKAREELPRAAPDWDSRFATEHQDLSLSIEGAQFPAEAELEFYPIANDLVAHAAPQRLAVDAQNGLRLSQRLSNYFVVAPESVEGVLVVREAAGARAFQIAASPGKVEAVPEAAVSASAPAPEGIGVSLPLILAFALLGGLILNLMPCVFPVLSLKALSMIQTGAQSSAAQRRHCLAYTAGVLASFMLVAAILIALRASGLALGWGFQLQSPVFVALLSWLMFAVGLSFSGAVHFGTGWMGAGQSLAAKPGLAGSFFTGVLAVVVASPCTAPFMGPALGFALTQAAWVSLPVFIALGLGLALPFLLLGFVPALARALPRPGPWMETFKHTMAFPMYLTAVWLLWVLGGLTDRDGMAWALVGMVLVALALWLRSANAGPLRRVAGALALVAAGLTLFHPDMRVGPPRSPGAAAGDHEIYSDARFAELRAQGRSVFVDFTADWCLTCKFNELGALRSAQVREMFAKREVVTLVGDWTRADPAITAVLARYGRSGVPLYLASRSGAEPIVLPQVLTPALVADAYR